MKKILFVTYDFPYPTTSGGKNRAYNLIKFAGNGHDIHLFSFTRDDFKKEYVDQIKKIGVLSVTTHKRRKVKDIRNIIGVFSPTQSIFKKLYFDKSILSLLIDLVVEKKVDVIHFESFYTGFYISSEFKKLDVKQIFGTENIEHQVYKDYVSNRVSRILKPLYEREVGKIKKEEEEMFEASDICLAVTEAEKKIINDTSTKKCSIIENGIDINSFTYKKPEKNEAVRLLFVGNFSYFPNVDAINFFYSDVFKNLSGQFRLTIIGKKAHGLLAKNDSRINCIEFVSDIKDAYKNCDIMVSPVRIGGGTNFKILEAMAAGVPIIAHPARLQSLGVVSGKHVVTAKTADEFISTILKLSLDYKKRVALSAAARVFVEEKYSWENIGKKLNSIWENL